MAIDPRIGLSPVMVPSVSKALNIYDNALLSAEARKQRELEAPMRQRLLEAQTQQAEQGVTTGQQAIEQEKQNSIIRSIAEFSPIIKPLLENAIKTGDTAEAQTALTQRLIQLQKQGRDTTETVEAITQLRNGNPQQVLAEVNAIDAAAQQRGLNLGPRKSVGQQEFSSLITQAQGDPESLETKAARIKLGLDPRAVGSAEQTVAQDEELQGEVINYKRKVIDATKLAEKAATEKGEILTDVNRARAAMPGLVEVVGQLRELAPIVTSTIGGKLFDTASKELGFGATKGSTARAKFTALVNNQILPLLKQTFGAAFTVAEADELKATMGDPDAAPEEKLAQLDAFIEQKFRSLEEKESQLGGFNAGDSGGFKIISVE